MANSYKYIKLLIRRKRMAGYYMMLITQVQLQINMTRPGKIGLIYAQNDFESINGNKFLSVIYIVSKILSYMHKSMKNSIELTECGYHTQNRRHMS